MSNTEKAFILEMAIGYRLEKTVKLLRTELQRKFKEAGYDITAYQFHILYRLWQKEGLFLTQLKENSLLDNARITREVDALEKKNLVERRSIDNDRRKVVLFLTEKGRSIKEDLLQIQIQHYEKSLEKISEDDLKNLERILKQVDENMGS